MTEKERKDNLHNLSRNRKNTLAKNYGLFQESHKHILTPEKHNPIDTWMQNY